MITKQIKITSLWPRESRKGSALMTILIIGMGLLTVLGVTLRWGITEKRLNIQHLRRQAAKNAAESVVEYGFADLIQRFTNQTSFPLDELAPQNNPLALPSTFATFFGGTNIDTANAELHGGMVPPGEWIYIDPSDPANEFDPLKGKRVFVRDVVVFGKATAESSGFGSAVTAYTRQKLQVRDAPLFGHAIFYNMDLELHPGPVMNVHGPVHSNTDAWLQAANKITFHEGVYAAGQVLHGNKRTGGHSQSGTVNVKDATGTSQNMYNGGTWNVDTSWLDHRDSDWRELASQRWDGNVQDVDHSVPTLNPIGIADYVPDDPFTPANELENYGYSVIEPVLPTNHPDYKGEAIRNQKFAYKAGLILSVDDSADPTDPGSFRVKAYKYQRTNPLDPGSPPALDTDGNPIRVEVNLPTGLIGDLAATGTPHDDYKDIEVDAKFEEYETSGGDVTGGMYDHREDVQQDMLSIDISRLRDLVDDTDGGYAPTDWETNHDGGDVGSDYVPSAEWNGVVYVEFPTVANSGGRVDKVVQAKTYSSGSKVLGLQLVDGRSAGADDGLPRPSYTSEIGLTVATNAPMYIVGHYNADGNSHSNDANTLDNASEPPAAVISDSLTVLSNEWFTEHRKNSDHSSTTGRKIKDSGQSGSEGFTEVSAAILTGLKPSIPDDPVTGASSGTQSGGAHNFPRFLEKWSGVTLTIRGSLVALFESEVHVDAMPNNFSHYYSPPGRDWGFNDNFRNGVYPPGSPNARTFRRVAFQDMTRDEYNTEVANIWAP